VHAPPARDRVVTPRVPVDLVRLADPAPVASLDLARAADLVAPQGAVPVVAPVAPAVNVVLPVGAVDVVVATKTSSSRST
jgi:hypothetical protein